jgi:hypothetical protein
MVLLERENPTRYLYLMRGIRNHVESREAGGFAGWVRALAEYDPHVVITTDQARGEMGADGATRHRREAAHPPRRPGLCPAGAANPCGQQRSLLGPYQC